MNDKTYLAGIDVGTTGTKTIIFDPEGRTIGSSYREYGCAYPKPNWVEQDADMLVRCSIETSREAIERAGVRAEDIAAISFSTQRTCTLFLDGDGKLVRPMISWQDNRTGEEVRIVEEKLGRERFHKITCLSLGAIWILNKILWLRRNELKNWSTVRKVVQLQAPVINH